MKKTYIMPALYVKGIKVNNILAGSPGFKDGEAGSGDAKVSVDFDDEEVENTFGKVNNTIW